MDENNINNNNTDNNLPNNEEVLNNNLASNDSTLNDNVTNNENTANTNTTTNMQSNEPNNGEEIKKEASAQEIVKKETVNVVQNNQPINNSKQNTNNMENDKKQVNDKKGFSIAALVLGIVAIVLSCIWYISIPCAILAIVFGILEKELEIGDRVNQIATISANGDVEVGCISCFIDFLLKSREDLILFSKKVNAF